VPAFAKGFASRIASTPLLFVCCPHPFGSTLAAIAPSAVRVLMKNIRNRFHKLGVLPAAFGAAQSVQAIL